MDFQSGGGAFSWLFQEHQRWGNPTNTLASLPFPFLYVVIFELIFLVVG